MEDFSPPKLALATNNQGKVREFRALLHGLPFELVTPAELGIAFDVVETGQSFAENACLKAVILSRLSQLVSLGDDSGLEVDALGGEPGIRSSRYAGENATDTQRIDFLLRRLENVPKEKRTARFVCVIALAAPDGRVKTARGECRGLILTQPRGTNGFGYDPVFYFPELDKTMAELPEETKNRISHRGHAARQVPALFDSLTGPVIETGEVG